MLTSKQSKSKNSMAIHPAYLDVKEEFYPMRSFNPCSLLFLANLLKTTVNEDRKLPPLKIQVKNIIQMTLEFYTKSVNGLHI